MAARLEIGQAFWFGLMWGLRERGGGCRESGAFLLGPPNGARVTESAYYDDLDPDALNAGHIQLGGRAYVPLSDICKQRRLAVKADIHTHPGAWTGQSPSDQKHPMMPCPGHIALIVPNFAKGNRFILGGVGAYLYHGEGRWSDCRSDLRLRLW
jgi:hypothetical protein